MDTTPANMAFEQELAEWLRHGAQLRTRLSEERKALAARIVEIDRQLAAIPRIEKGQESHPHTNGMSETRGRRGQKQPGPAILEVANIVATAHEPVDREWVARQLGTNRDAAGTRLLRAVRAKLIRRGPKKGTFIMAT